MNSSDRNLLQKKKGREAEIEGGVREEAWQRVFASGDL